MTYCHHCGKPRATEYCAACHRYCNPYADHDRTGAKE